MDRNEWIDSDIDEPYRTCEIDDLKYHEEHGESCRICDVWICRNCWPDHTKETGHTEKSMPGIGDEDDE